MDKASKGHNNQLDKYMFFLYMEVQVRCRLHQIFTYIECPEKHGPQYLIEWRQIVVTVPPRPDFATLWLQCLSFWVVRFSQSCFWIFLSFSISSCFPRSWIKQHRYSYQNLVKNSQSRFLPSNFSLSCFSFCLIKEMHMLINASNYI